MGIDGAFDCKKFCFSRVKRVISLERYIKITIKCEMLQIPYKNKSSLDKTVIMKSTAASLQSISK